MKYNDETKVGEMVLRLDICSGSDGDESYMVVRRRGEKIAGSNMGPISADEVADIVDRLHYESEIGDVDPDSAIHESIRQLRHRLEIERTTRGDEVIA